MIRRLLWALVFSIALVVISSPSLAQTYDDAMQAESEHYREGSLRRFEIIFTISLPFTSLHSYLAVRGVEMIRQDKISPKFSDTHWNTVGGLTILFSGFVAFWDYLHTRNEDIHDMGMPVRQIEPPAAMPSNRYSYQAAFEEPMLGLLSVRF